MNQSPFHKTSHYPYKLPNWKKKIVYLIVENFFPTMAQFTILRVTLEIELKIFSFLSLQMDHSIANGIMLQSIQSDLTKGPPSQDSAANAYLDVEKAFAFDNCL